MIFYLIIALVAIRVKKATTVLLWAVALQIIGLAETLNPHPSGIALSFLIKIAVGGGLFWLFKKKKALLPPEKVRKQIVVASVCISIALVMTAAVPFYFGIEKGRELLNKARLTSEAHKQSETQITQKSTNSSLPEQLLYEGTPIDPECIREVTEKQPQDLRFCGAKKRNDDDEMRVKGELKITENSAGYEYTYSDAYGGFFEYEFIGETAEGIAIKATESGGGTGVFDSLKIYKRNGNIISLVKEVADGERCHGGISNVHMQNGQIAYSASMTALGLFEAYKPDRKGLEIFKDLSDCMICCFGEVYKNGDKVEKIELSASDTFLDVDAQESAQGCFSRHYKEKVAAGSKTFSELEIRLFMNKVSSQCISEFIASPKTQAALEKSLRVVVDCYAENLPAIDDRVTDASVIAKVLLNQCEDITQSEDEKLKTIGSLGLDKKILSDFAQEIILRFRVKITQEGQKKKKSPHQYNQ